MSRQSPPDFKAILARMQTALEHVDVKIKTAKDIEKLLLKALETPEAKGKVVIEANLRTNLFMIQNTIESFEAGKKQLKGKALQVVGMIKLAAAQKKTQAKAQKKPQLN